MYYINTELKLIDGKKIRYNNDYLLTIKEDIEKFLDTEKYMSNLRFAKKMMMSQEIKSNNSIEGIYDDLTLIDEVIKNKNQLSNIEKSRIVNLYHGYQYILTHQNINKESIKELYKILSDGLLDAYSINNMGKYYREKPVYILKGDRLDVEPYQGMDEKYVEEYMDKLFKYINNDNNVSNNKIDYFIKSQIIHFYFVYIHPYFDINGRTSRTTSMWYLLNNKSYPYIIFNRSIAFNQRNYEPTIITTRKTGNITLFLKYILENVKTEFEKEYIIHTITELCNSKLTKDNLQTLEYILTMKCNLTLKDFVTTYNRFNDKKDIKDIIVEKFEPLVKKNIIIPGENTKGYINKYNELNNYYFSLNDKFIDIDKNKIKNLKIERFIKK